MQSKLLARVLFALFALTSLPGRTFTGEVAYGQQAAPPPALFLSSALAGMSQSTPSLNNVHLIGAVTWKAGSLVDSGTADMIATPSGPFKLLLTLRGRKNGYIKYPPFTSGSSLQLFDDGHSANIAAHNLTGGPDWFFPEYLLQRMLAPGMMSAATSECPANETCIWTYPATPSNTQVSYSRRMYGTLAVFDDSHRLVSVSFNEHPDDHPDIDIPVRISYDTYEMFQGHLVPYHMQETLSGSPHLDITISEIVSNVALDASLLGLR